MGEQMYRVNLLPPKLQHEEIVDVSRLLIIAVVTFFSVIILLAGGFFIINYFTMRNEIATATQQVTALQPTVNSVENLRKERKAMEATVGDYKALLNKQITWSSLLYELDDIAPADLWLVELNIQNVQAAPAAAAAGKTTATAAPKTAAKGKAAPEAPEPILRPNNIAIKGVSTSVPSVGIFVKNLQQLPYFKDVVLKNITSQANGNSFEITAYIKDDISG